MPEPERDNPQLNFETWKSQVPQFLDDAIALFGDDGSKLDYSLDSLDVVERWVRKRDDDGWPKEEMAVELNLLGCYAGEVFLRHTWGGDWILPSKESVWHPDPVIRFEGRRAEYELKFIVARSIDGRLSIRGSIERYIEAHSKDSGSTKPSQSNSSFVIRLFHSDVESEVKKGCDLESVSLTTIPKQIVTEFAGGLNGYGYDSTDQPDVFRQRNDGKIVRITEHEIRFEVQENAEQVDAIMDASMAACELGFDSGNVLRVYFPFDGTWADIPAK